MCPVRALFAKEKAVDEIDLQVDSKLQLAIEVFCKVLENV